MNIVTMVSGHEMYLDTYKNKLEFFKNSLIKFGIEVLAASTKPKIVDYSFMVNGNFEKLPKEVIEIFGRAGLATRVEFGHDGTKIISMTYTGTFQKAA